MTNKNFMTAQDVADALGVSKSYAYKLVRQLMMRWKHLAISLSGAEWMRITFVKKYVTANKGKEVVEWLYTKIMPQERGG